MIEKRVINKLNLIDAYCGNISQGVDNGVYSTYELYKKLKYNGNLYSKVMQTTWGEIHASVCHFYIIVW